MSTQRERRSGRSGCGAWVRAGAAGMAGWAGVASVPGVLSAVGLATAGPLASSVLAQVQANPVYVDESPTATDSLTRVREHLASGNLDEAVRVVQTLLDEAGEKVVASEGDAELLTSVRTRVHGLLAGDAALLARYRAVVGPRAERLAEEGQWATLERTLLFTPSGLDAALRLAQSQIEDARFQAARLTLEQLPKHPDLSGARATLAVRTVTELARFDSGPEMDRLAAALAQAGGGGAKEGEGERVEWPASARATGVSPLVPAAALDESGLLPRPLWSASISGAVPEDSTGGPGATEKAKLQRAFENGAGSSELPRFARSLLIMPSATGDVVLVSDGTTISALDRFTLSPRWSITPGIPDVREGDAGVRGSGRVRLERLGGWGGSRAEDLCTVAVAPGGRTAVAATGRSAAASRDGDDAVHAIDIATGAVRWSVRVGAIDPVLADATVRGPIEVSEQTVIVAARKYLPERRLVSLTLVGLDLATGATRWVRPLGSAGSLPFVAGSVGAEGTLVDRGVAYRVDRLGVLGAVDIDTGRVRWVRRMPVDATVSADQAVAWQLSTPVMDGDALVFIAPDGRRLVRVEAATGKELARKGVGELVQVAPKYLLKAGAMLAMVCEDRVYACPIAEFGQTRPRLVLGPIPPPGLRGRVVVAGDRLIAPIVGGVSIVDLQRGRDAGTSGPGAKEAGPATTLVLDEPGNVLALGSQLIVTDDARVHSYLQWEVAERLLNERMRASPQDPAPAVTLAELAYRASRPERVLDAVDRAMAAMGPLDGPGAMDVGSLVGRERERLAEALVDMLTNSLERAPGAGNANASSSGSSPVISDQAILVGIADRLAKLVRRPEQAVGLALSRGRLAEKRGALAEAVEQYQSILADGAAAQTVWRGPQVSIRAELEATRRIEVLVRSSGPEVYAAADARAQSELAALGANATIQQLETLATTYPLARQTPGVYLRLAQLRAQTPGAEQAHLLALEAGIRAAQRHPSPELGSVAALGGKLVGELTNRGQFSAAAGVARGLAAAYPGLTLGDGGGAKSIEKVLEELSLRIAESTRWPKVGPVSAEGVQVLAGWELMEPLLRDSAPSFSQLVCVRSEDQIAVFGPQAGVGGGANGNGSSAPLVKAWSAPTSEYPGVHLIKAQGDWAYVLMLGENSGVVQKIGRVENGAAGVGAGGPAAGESSVGAVWSSGDVIKALGRDEPKGVRRLAGVLADRFGEDGSQSTDLIVSMDDRTLTLAQRGGRVLALDLTTGQVLWALQAALGHVYDADLVGGSLVLAGAQEIAGAGGAVADLRPVLMVLDARTGRTIQRAPDAGGHARWVRLLSPTNALVGSETSVVSIDLTSGQANWTITRADIQPVSGAWIIPGGTGMPANAAGGAAAAAGGAVGGAGAGANGDTLVLLGPDRNLYVASAASGRVRDAALELPRPMIDSTRFIDVFASGGNDGGFAVSTQQGLALYAGDASLIGTDAGRGSGQMLMPRPAIGRAVTVETTSEGRAGDGLMTYTLSAMELPTGGPAGGGGGAGAAGGPRLLETRGLALGAKPTSLQLLDGRIAVTAGASTIVLRAPAAK